MRDFENHIRLKFRTKREKKLFACTFRRTLTALSYGAVTLTVCLNEFFHFYRPEELITGAIMPLKRAVGMNGKVLKIDQEVRIIGSIRDFYDYVFYDAAHTCDFDEVLFLSSVLWVF